MMDDMPEQRSEIWEDDLLAGDDMTPSLVMQRGKRRHGALLAFVAVIVALAVVLVAVIVHNNAGKTTRRGTLRPSQAQLLQAALRTSGTLTWGSDPALGAPAVFVDPAHPQAVTGFDADLVAALAQRLHLQAQFTPVTWTSFPQALQSHAIDIFADGVVPADIPPNDATFSSPYLITSTVLVVRNGDTRFTDLKSLDGHPVGVVTGDRGVALAQTDTHLLVQAYDHILPFEALASGRIDAVIISSPLAQWYGARDSLKRFMVLPQAYDPAPVALALAINGAHSHDLNAILSQTLRDMAQDGSLTQILQRWGMTDPLQQCIVAPTKAQGCPAQ